MVKADSCFGTNNTAHFGYLVDLSMVFGDAVTGNQIEFSDEDAIEEYHFNSEPQIDYIDPIDFQN